MIDEDTDAQRNGMSLVNSKASTESSLPYHETCALFYGSPPNSSTSCLLETTEGLQWCEAAIFWVFSNSHTSLFFLSFFHLFVCLFNSVSNFAFWDYVPGIKSEYSGTIWTLDITWEPFTEQILFKTELEISKKHEVSLGFQNL